MASIYIVEVTPDGGDMATRSVVIAASASDAGAPYAAADRTVEVGRIGEFDPGRKGAELYERSGDEIVTGPAR